MSLQGGFPLAGGVVERAGFGFWWEPSGVSGEGSVESLKHVSYCLN